MDCLKTEKGVRSKIHTGGVCVPLFPLLSFLVPDLFFRPNTREINFPSP